MCCCLSTLNSYVRTVKMNGCKSKMQKPRQNWLIDEKYCVHRIQFLASKAIEKKKKKRKKEKKKKEKKTQTQMVLLHAFFLFFLYESWNTQKETRLNEKKLRF